MVTNLCQCFLESRCQCGHCIVEEREVDCLCCVELEMAASLTDRHVTEHREEVECLTRTYGFTTVCLDIDVLRVAYFSFQSLPGPHNAVTQHRYTAYRQLTRWLHGRMGRHNRTVHPSCCVAKIRATFPSSDGHYVHYSALERP